MTLIRASALLIPLADESVQRKDNPVYTKNRRQGLGVVVMPGFVEERDRLQAEEPCKVAVL